MSTQKPKRRDFIESIPDSFTDGKHGTGDGRGMSDVKDMKQQFAGFGSIDWDARYGEYIRKKS